MNKIKLIFVIFLFINVNSEIKNIKSIENVGNDSTETESKPKYTKGGALTGGRSRASIMRVVMKNLSPLKKAYNMRLLQKKGLWGKIIVKFAIDEFGSIIYCKVISSTVNDSLLENEINNLISKWNFDKIHKPGDVTEVVYPFVFTTNQSPLDVRALDIVKSKKGTRDSKKIIKTIDRKKYKLDRIHSSNFPNESGRLTLRLTVDYKGKVIHINTTESTIKKGSESEIINTVYLWDFNKDRSSYENTEFDYTFIFHKKN